MKSEPETAEPGHEGNSGGGKDMPDTVKLEQKPVGLEVFVFHSLTKPVVALCWVIDTGGTIPALLWSAIC